MAITSEDAWIAAAVQRIVLNRSASLTTVANMPASVFGQAGNPGAGTLAGTSTSTGTVPTDATAGCPLVNAFGGSAKGYVARLEFGNSVACRIQLYDLLWKGGAYAFNANTSAQSPTSFSSRVPGGTDFTGLELWLEQVTAGTLIQNVNVTYVNQAGTTGRSTGTVAPGSALIVGRMFQLPLQAGDSGLTGVTGVVGSVASAGTFNILVLRPLGSARIRNANDAQIQGMYETGAPEVFADSALYTIVTADSTASGLPEVVVDIRNG